LLEAAHLCKSFRDGKRVTEALADVSLRVDDGEFATVVGPSGCGKTTLVRCLAGLIPATSGEVRLDGRRVTAPPRELTVVFQDYSRSLLPWLSARRNVALPLRHLDRRARAARVAESLAEVGLSGFADHYPWQLSGGMQQRVALARALAYRPRYLLMDEPFASVDAQTRSELQDMILRLRRRHGMTTVFVTHDIDEAIYLSDRVHVLTAAPARVAEVVDVDLPPERDQVVTKALPAFTALRGVLWHRLTTGSRDASAAPAPQPARTAR
jgi:NitT/TauT family transport system ATP-binding protein